MNAPLNLAPSYAGFCYTRFLACHLAPRIAYKDRSVKNQRNVRDISSFIWLNYSRLVSIAAINDVLLMLVFFVAWQYPSRRLRPDYRWNMSIILGSSNGLMHTSNHFLFLTARENNPVSYEATNSHVSSLL